MSSLLIPLCVLDSYIYGHPNTSILSAGSESQASGNSRTHRASTGVGRGLTTSDKLSMFAVNVCELNDIIIFFIIFLKFNFKIVFVFY